MAIPQSSIIALSLMYTKLPPSASDLTYWASPEGQSVSWNQAVQAFSTSSAAKASYPMLASPTVLSQNAAARRQYVIQAFENLYGIAEADIPAAELTYWADTYLVSSPQAIFDFPVVLNQYSPASRQQALTNRAQVSENFATALAAAGSSTFTPAQYSAGWAIVNTVTANAATVTAANAKIAEYVAGGGGTGITFTLLEPGAVLTNEASTHVSPADKYLSNANDKINGTVFLDGSVIQDPSTSDNDVLSATILPLAFGTIPFISKIENIKLTGSPGAAIQIANISDVKNLEFVTGNIQVNTSEKHPLNLAKDYSGTLTLSQANPNSKTTVNLNGTVAGTRIVDLNNASDINLVVKADSVLKAGDTTTNSTILDSGANTNFVISGDKNLTIEGAVQMALINSTAQLDASALTGKLTLDLANIGVGINPFSVKQIVGGKSDDSFTLTAVTDQLVGVVINGSDGKDTLTASLGVDNIVTPTALNGVTNVETVIVKQTSVTFVTNLKPADSFVAPNKSATVDGSSFTSSKLNYNGSLESNGTLNIIGGANADTLVGGAKNDTLTGGGLGDTLNGGAGNDTFVYKSIADSNADAFLTQLSFDTINNFGEAGDVLDLTAVGFTSTQFLGTPAGFVGDQATLLLAATKLSQQIGKNSLAAFTYTGAELAFKGNTFVLGTNDSNTGVVDAGDLFIKLTGALTLTSVNFA